MNLASRGLRDMDNGPEALAEQELAAVRSQARRVYLKSVVAGVAVAILATVV